MSTSLKCIAASQVCGRCGRLLLGRCGRDVDRRRFRVSVITRKPQGSPCCNNTHFAVFWKRETKEQQSDGRGNSSHATDAADLLTICWLSGIPCVRHAADAADLLVVGDAFLCYAADAADLVSGFYILCVHDAESAASAGYHHRFAYVFSSHRSMVQANLI